MATYGQHECMYMDSDVTIERCSCDWFYTVYVETTEDKEKYETIIKFCPFCGEELN